MSVEITASRVAEVGGVPVRRALPQRTRRTVGPWCFADHLGPLTVTPSVGMDVGPHPHMGLQTVTWLAAGEVLHRDSLGSEQLVRPGQLNLMTAGHGVSHAEESTGRYSGDLHGIQLWVAQPEATRHGAAAFEHHASPPMAEFGTGLATVLVGDLDGITSTARRDTDHAGIDLRLQPGKAVLPLDPGYEYAIVVLLGAATLKDPEPARVTPGELAYLGAGRDELEITATETTQLLLLGGEPFESPILMWWNFVGRTRDELNLAGLQWNDPGSDPARFGDPGSRLVRIPAPPTPWES